MARVLKAVLMGVVGLVCAIIISVFAKILITIAFECFGWWSAGAWALFATAAFSAMAYFSDDARA